MSGSDDLTYKRKAIMMIGTIVFLFASSVVAIVVGGSALLG